MYTNSNTTLVKVKLRCDKRRGKTVCIQIQHLLKLNLRSYPRSSPFGKIQIQHLLKLNNGIGGSLFYKRVIQIQHLLKLNFKNLKKGHSNKNSNTTLVKVKLEQLPVTMAGVVNSNTTLVKVK